MERVSMTRAVEDEAQQEIEVRLGPAHPSRKSYGDDPFDVPAEEIKTLGGVSQNTKRRISTQIKKAYTGIEDAKSKKIEYTVTGYDAFEVIQPPYNLDYLAELYEISAPHYAAVKAKTSNIVGLGFSLVESPKTERRLESLVDDPKGLDFQRQKISRFRDMIADRLDSLNKEDTFIEVLTKVWIDYETTGNGYIEIGRTTNGVIGYIGHIPSTTMRVRRDRDGYVQIISNKAVYFRNFGEDTPNPIGNDTRPNEIIHVKKYSPTNGYYGISDVVSAKIPIAGNDFAARYNLDYFENKAVPRYVITLKGAPISVQAQIQILEFFETGIKSKNHRTLYIPLPPDTPDNKVEFKMDAIESGVQEGSFEKYKNSNIAEILMAHRVPISKVSAAINISLANARDADKTFKEQVCQPEQDMLEKRLNRTIFAELTDALIIKFNEMSLTDAITQANIDQIYLRNDATTPNRILARDGQPGLPDGDETVGMMSQIKVQIGSQEKIANKNAKVQQQTAAQQRVANQGAADQRVVANQSRERDASRSINSPDRDGTGRQPKGEGRVTR